MPNSKGRRRFGSVRRLPSGRYQARYPGPDGVVRPADDTFETKTDAEAWLTRTEAEILEDEWIDPDAGEVLLADYLDACTVGKPLRKPRERHQPVRLSSCPASASQKSPAVGCGMPYVCE